MQIITLGIDDFFISFKNSESNESALYTILLILPECKNFKLIGFDKVTSTLLFFIIFAKLTLAVSTIYIFGVIWLGTLIGWEKPIFSLGVAPFLMAETFKVLLLSLLVKKLIKLKKFI